MTEKKEGITVPYLIAIALLIMIAVVTFSVSSLIDRRQAESSTNYNDLAAPAQASAPTVSGEKQNAKLALVNFKYTLTPNKIKKGVPARIEVDSSSLSGCMTTVVFKDFGITKRITPTDNIIEFTPDKAGTFWITCGMGMGPGSYEVVNADGSPGPSTASTAPPSGGSCGAGGGGCGCGAR